MQNLNLISPCNTLGYGYVSSYLLKELSKLYQLSYFPIGQISCEQKFISFIQQSLKNAELFDPKAPSLRIFHEFQLDLFPGKGIKIGFPFFETNIFSDRVKHHLQQCDYLFVASEWARQVILNQTRLSQNKIFVVPLGIDPTIFFPDNNIKQDNKVIYFNIGKIELRKGHDLIPEAFQKAFSLNDDVELWMMWDNPFLSQDQSKQWENYYRAKLGYKVQFIPRVNTHEELAKLINISNIGLFPSRSEAWNLEIGEFLACGKQLISTEYSGMTQYLNEKNSLLLKPNGMEAMWDGLWFDGTSTWPILKVDDLVDLLRLSYKNYKNNPEKNINGIETMKKYTWENSAKLIKNILETIN